MKTRLVFFILISFLTLNNLAYGALFKGLDLRTKKITALKTSSKKNIVAYFISSSCPCSQAHFDHLNTLQKRFPNFSFVGFQSNRKVTANQASKYFSKYKIDFPIILDRDLKYANELKAVKTPHVFILSPKKEILFQGGATNSRNPKRASQFYLENALSEITAGKEISVKNAKTIGCYIQR